MSRFLFTRMGSPKRPRLEAPAGFTAFHIHPGRLQAEAASLEEHLLVFGFVDEEGVAFEPPPWMETEGDLLVQDCFLPMLIRLYMPLRNLGNVLEVAYVADLSLEEVKGELRAAGIELTRIVAPYWSQVILHNPKAIGTDAVVVPMAIYGRQFGDPRSPLPAVRTDPESGLKMIYPGGTFGVSDNLEVWTYYLDRLARSLEYFALRGMVEKVAVFLNMAWEDMPAYGEALRQSLLGTIDIQGEL